MDLLFKLFDVLFPVFLIIGIGYWYGKKDPKFDTKFITTFAGNFGLPAIIFYSLTGCLGIERKYKIIASTSSSVINA